ncbi:hypothetical protein CsSME_00028561 [Camellia sinensis var. sinensis]
MAFVADSPIKSKPVLDRVGNIGGRENVANVNVRGIGVKEVNSGVIACDVDVALGIGGETAGERGEVGESAGEAVFEEREERVDGERRAGEEATLLNVVAGEHGEVGDGELEVSDYGFAIRKDSAVKRPPEIEIEIAKMTGLLNKAFSHSRSLFL